MFTVSRILVPIDFSDVSRAALSAAIQLADRHNAHLYVLHVQPNLQRDLHKRLTSAPNESVIEKGIAAGELNLMNMIEREYVTAEKSGVYLRDVPVTVQISGGDVLDAVHARVPALQVPAGPRPPPEPEHPFPKRAPSLSERLR